MAANIPGFCSCHHMTIDPTFEYYEVSHLGHEPELVKTYKEVFPDNLGMYIMIHGGPPEPPNPNPGKFHSNVEGYYRCKNCGLELTGATGNRFCAMIMEPRNYSPRGFRQADFDKLTCEQLQAKRRWVAIAKISEYVAEIDQRIRKLGGEKVSVGMDKRITFEGNIVLFEKVHCLEKVDKVIER